MVITSAVDPMLHATRTITDVADGLARIIRCPDCGGFEIWSMAEIDDHGHCRADANRCPVCADAEEYARETAEIAARELEISLAEDAADIAAGDSDADDDAGNWYDGTETVLRSVIVARGWQWRASYVTDSVLWPDGLTTKQRERLGRIVRDLFETLALRAGVDAVWWIEDGEVVAIDPPDQLPNLNELRRTALNAVWEQLETGDLHPDDINGIYDAAYDALSLG